MAEINCVSCPRCNYKFVPVKTEKCEPPELEIVWDTQESSIPAAEGAALEDHIINAVSLSSTAASAVPQSHKRKPIAVVCEELLLKGSCNVSRCTDRHEGISLVELKSYIDSALLIHVRKIIEQLMQKKTLFYCSLSQSGSSDLLEAACGALLKRDSSSASVELVLDAMLTRTLPCLPVVCMNALERMACLKFPAKINSLCVRLREDRVVLDQKSWCRLLRCLVDAGYCAWLSVAIHTVLDCHPLFDLPEVEINAVVMLFVRDIQKEQSEHKKNVISKELLKLLSRLQPSILRKVRLELQEKLSDLQAYFIDPADGRMFDQILLDAVAGNGERDWLFFARNFLSLDGKPLLELFVQNLNKNFFAGAGGVENFSKFLLKLSEIHGTTNLTTLPNPLHYEALMDTVVLILQQLIAQNHLDTNQHIVNCRSFSLTDWADSEKFTNPEIYLYAAHHCAESNELEESMVSFIIDLLNRFQRSRKNGSSSQEFEDLQQRVLQKCFGVFGQL